MTEDFKIWMIDQFKKRETDLLLRALEYNGTPRYLVQSFMSDQFCPVSVTYDKELKQFTELTFFIGGKGKTESINLTQ